MSMEDDVKVVTSRLLMVEIKGSTKYKKYFESIPELFKTMLTLLQDQHSISRVRANIRPQMTHNEIVSLIKDIEEIYNSAESNVAEKRLMKTERYLVLKIKHTNNTIRYCREIQNTALSSNFMHLNEDIFVKMLENILSVQELTKTNLVRLCNTRVQGRSSRFIDSLMRSYRATLKREIRTAQCEIKDLSITLGDKTFFPSLEKIGEETYTIVRIDFFDAVEQVMRIIEYFPDLSKVLQNKDESLGGAIMKITVVLKKMSSSNQTEIEELKRLQDMYTKQPQSQQIDDAEEAEEVEEA